MSKHVAIFGYPIPALINPTFSIVSSLIRRGYRVTYVTSERFAAELSSLGAEVLRCPRIDAPCDQDEDEMLPIEHQYARYPVGLAARIAPRVERFYEHSKPDLVIYDSMAFAGILVADQCAVPAVRMSNQFLYDFAVLSSDTLPGSWRDEQLELERRANQFFISIDSDRRDVIRGSRDATFYPYLRDLQLGAAPSPAAVFYAPRCIAERPNIPRWKSQARTRRRALIASSTTYGQNPRDRAAYLRALSAAGWETMLVVGNSPAAELESLPALCQPIRDIPLASLMPHADLLICAAGMATAMEAAYHGLPMLMLTGGQPELEAYAEKFQSHGMGVHLRQESSAAENVASLAARMIDDGELSDRVKRVQSAVRRGAGAEEVVNWLEQHLPGARQSLEGQVAG